MFVSSVSIQIQNGNKINNECNETREKLVNYSQEIL